MCCYGDSCHVGFLLVSAWDRPHDAVQVSFLSSGTRGIPHLVTVVLRWNPTMFPSSLAHTLSPSALYPILRVPTNPSPRPSLHESSPVKGGTTHREHPSYVQCPERISPRYRFPPPPGPWSRSTWPSAAWGREGIFRGGYADVEKKKGAKGLSELLASKWVEKAMSCSS